MSSINGGQFSVSSDGHLAFQHSPQLSELVWVNERGESESLPFPHGRYFDPQIDPNGEFIVVHTLDDDSNYNIAIGDLESGTLRTLVRDESYDLLPLWSLDSQSIYFSSTRDAGPDIYRVHRAADDDQATRLFPQPPSGQTARWPCGWSTDGRLLANINGELMLVDLEQPSETQAVGVGKIPTRNVSVHPAGNWIAYGSNEDRAEPHQVFVERFPQGGWKVQVTASGGHAPVWSPQGDRLYFQKDENLWYVEVLSAEPELRCGRPQVLFPGPYRSSVEYTEYDVHPEGDRFLMIKPVSENRKDNEIVVVLNWLAQVNAEQTSGSVGAE